ncbi:MAG: BlaI/MecI/CopY family transcriptional regulator [Bryobacteraceae bacterium]
MARNKSLHLTDAELRLMEVLWDKGTATVSEVMEGLPSNVALAYSTVITTLRILENKGYVKHAKDGRAFVYQAIVGREEARHSAVTHLVRRFFEGSPERLMLSLIEDKKVDRKELARLRKLIEKEDDS